MTASPHVDRTAVVMSIRGVYCDQIFQGWKPRKVFEFRRRPLPPDVTTVLVYRSGDPECRGIIGQFTPAPAEQVTARTIIGRAAARGYRMGQADPQYGITGTDLAKYAGGHDRPISAIPIISPTPIYPYAPELDVFGWERPPQSWRYAPSGWLDLILEKLEKTGRSA